MTVTISRRGGNLPTELTSFVGRRRELGEVKRLLATGRLVTLAGMGGVGKTRLASRAAWEVRRAFPDGTWFVDLASEHRPGSPVRAVAEALGSEEPWGPAGLMEHLKDRRLLLVLDNCEHLLDECVALVSLMLCGAPGLRILATSRQLLGLNGEHVLDVRPLPVPEAADAMAGCDAVRLFAERATAASPDFTLERVDVGAVARLCKRLDGIPLAIELAAAWTRALPVEHVIDRLDGRSGLLSRENRAGTPRHRSLRALIDWSHDLCSARERELWRRLSVFEDGCDLQAAQAVCSGGGMPPHAVLDATIGLVDKSVLSRDEDASSARYRLPETLRRYGLARLAESGEEGVLRRRHRDWCLRLTERAEAEWFGKRQSEWLGRLRAERANVVAALHFCLDEPGQERAALEIAAATWSVPAPFARVEEGHLLLRRSLTANPDPSPARAKALWVAARLFLLSGDPVTARALLRECRTLARQLGDTAQLACAVQVEGLASLLGGDPLRAVRLSERALAGQRAVGDEPRSWTALLQLAVSTALAGDIRSTELCRECRETCDGDAPWAWSYALWASGLDRWRNDDPQAAKSLIQEALRCGGDLGDDRLVAECLEVLVWAVADEGRDEEAARLLGAAGARRLSTGVLPPAHLAGPRDRYEAGLRRRLGDQAFTTARRAGSHLSAGDAVAFALEEEPAEPAADTGADADVASSLTNREREIAELVARGLSNRDIADTLVIAQRTAEGHVEHILRKLGFTSRAQIAAAWAARP